MKKYIIFDFNGTLLDDVSLGLKLLNDFLRDQNKPLVDMDRYRNIFGFPIINFYIEAGISFDEKSFEEMAVIYNERYMKESLSCKLFDDTIEVLSTLKDKGYKLICLSATEINNLIFQLKYYGIYEYFDKAIGTSNYEGGSKKELGYKFIKENNINPNDVLCVGDTLHDLEVSKMIGCDHVLFSGGHQSPSKFDGYNVINSLKEIMKYIWVF